MSSAPAYDVPATTTDDLTQWTPAQVDVALAEIHGRIADCWTKILNLQIDRGYWVKKTDPTSRWHYQGPEDAAKAQVKVDEYDAKIAALHDDIAALRVECEPYDAEYDSRPWTRAWIVTSSDGHVHNTMDCSTCNKQRQKRDGTWSAPTSFGWLPEVSGLPEDEIIMLAGEGACTVCYPSAPADVLNNPCRLDTAERKAQKAAAQAEKGAKTAERIAKGVTPTGRPLIVEWSYESSRERHVMQSDGSRVVVREPYIARHSKEMKTERAAELFAVETLAAIAKGKPVGYWCAGRETADEVLAALAWKRGTTAAEVEASLAKKVEKKRKAMY
jgi:hypothetical protein